MSTYFLLDPFEFPYYFYRIRGELIYVLSIVVCIPSTFCPTPQQKDFLNLGPNCHLFQRYTSINKNTEIEILYQNILKLRDNKVISISPEFRDLLKAEAVKNRYNKKQPTLLTHQLKTAAKELRNHPNITIKKADTTNIFVVLNKTDYHSKLQNILDDHTKFKKLN